MTSSKMPPFLREIFSKTPPLNEGGLYQRGLCCLERVLTLKEKYEDDVVRRVVLLKFHRGDINPADFLSEMKRTVLDDIEATNDSMCREIVKIHEHFEGRLSSEDTDISSPHLQPDTEVTTVYQLTLEDGTVHRLFAKKGDMLNVPAPYVEKSIDRALDALNLPKPSERRLG